MMKPAARMDQLVSAICDGNEARVRELLRAEPALASGHHAREFGSTPLIQAVRCDNYALVDLLLAAGADPNQRSDWWAGGFGVLDDCTEAMARYLMDRGATLTPHGAARLGMEDRLREMIEADGSLVHQRGGDGQFPLHFAATDAIAELLLAKGAAIDARDIDHEGTAAQWLATAHPGVARYLVSRGCAVDIFLAAMIGDIPLLDRFLAQEDGRVDIRLARSRFPTNPPAALHIYMYTVGEGCTLMHAAASADAAATITHLAGKGADVHARGGYDDATPLHQAAWKDSASAARALLDSGADINARSGRMHDNEPLGWAIVGGSPDVLRLLLERGATVRDTHREDAVAGARGAFRRLNRSRPLSRWEQVAALMAG